MFRYLFGDHADVVAHQIRQTKVVQIHQLRVVYLLCVKRMGDFAEHFYLIRVHLCVVVLLFREIAELRVVCQARRDDVCNNRENKLSLLSNKHLVDAAHLPAQLLQKLEVDDILQTRL